MAHPYHHAISSSQAYKDVTWQDHFPIHDWLDSSKFAFADARHRSLLHNPSGVLMASKIFKHIKNAKNIATQHITEDMGQVYTIKEWLPEKYLSIRVQNAQLLKISNEISLTDVKGSLIFNNPFPKDIQREISMGIDTLLSPDLTEKFEKEDIRRFFFFSSAGPYIVEKLLGPTLNPNKKPNKKSDKQLATRSVIEFFIQKVWGCIPSHQDIMQNRPIENWMWRKARPLSKEL